MKLLRTPFIFILTCGMLTAHSWSAEPPPSFADMVEKLTPAVVNISTTQKVKGMAPGMQMFGMPEDGQQMPEEFKDFFEQFSKQGHSGKEKGGAEHEVYSLGSGFIIDENGYVATNNHVIADAEEVTVILSDNTKLKATIVGRDAKTDLALLKVDAGRKLPFVPLGDSDVSRVGDWVIAIGNPFGLGGTVTAGIISARARNINAGPFDDFIQTDAAINRGNSGGPMFNMKGEVIGINTAIFSPSGGSIGIGFAVPMSLAKPVFAQLKATGHIQRGWLGVKIQTVTDEIADSVGLKKAEGALVMEVTPGSPSDKAGIKTGDIILTFDGKPVGEMRHLPRMVAETKIGKSVEVGIWRKGQAKTVRVTLGELKEEVAKETEPKDEDQALSAAPIRSKELLGMTLVPLTPDARERLGIKDSVKGALVNKIAPENSVAKRGIVEGDVITQIGDTAIADINDIGTAIAAAKSAGRKFVLVRMQRGEESMFVTLPVEAEKKK